MIKCGKDHFRSNGYCKACSTDLNKDDSTELCTECNGEGQCSKCLNTRYRRDNENGCAFCSTGCSSDGRTCSTMPEHCVGFDYGDLGLSCGCKICQPGYGPMDGVCVKCPSGSFSSNGTKCEVMAGCKESPEGSTSQNCDLCNSGYVMQAGRTCKPCPGTHYGGMGKTCLSIPHCLEGKEGQEHPSCTKCDDGYAVENGDCVKCPSTYYCVDGQVNEIEHCKEGNVGKSVPSCTKCGDGYGVDGNGRCRECKGTEYSMNGLCVSIAWCVRGQDHAGCAKLLCV